MIYEIHQPLKRPNSRILHQVYLQEVVVDPEVLRQDEVGYLPLHIEMHRAISGSILRAR
jgi:hypothetical protein